MIREVVEKAPRLTDEQKMRLRPLFEIDDEDAAGAAATVVRR